MFMYTHESLVVRQNMQHLKTFQTFFMLVSNFYYKFILNLIFIQIIMERGMQFSVFIQLEMKIGFIFII